MSLLALRDPSGALERALYDVLTGSALTANGQTVTVFDQAPVPMPWPHCAIEASTMSDSSAKGLRGHECTVTLRLGSSYAGGKELSAAVDAVLARVSSSASLTAMQTDLTAEGFTLHWLRIDLVERYRDIDPSGRMYRYAAVRYRFHTTQTT